MGKILVKTLHFKHTLTLRLAHRLPSFIVTCLPVDTLLIAATVVNSALINISTFQSRAAHHFQSQAWRTNIVLQKNVSQHMSHSTTHVTRSVTIMLKHHISKCLSLKTNLDPKAYELRLDGYGQVQHRETGLQDTELHWCSVRICVVTEQIRQIVCVLDGKNKYEK